MLQLKLILKRIGCYILLLFAFRLLFFFIFKGKLDLNFSQISLIDILFSIRLDIALICRLLGIWLLCYSICIIFNLAKWVYFTLFTIEIIILNLLLVLLYIDLFNFNDFLVHLNSTFKEAVNNYKDVTAVVLTQYWWAIVLVAIFLMLFNYYYIKFFKNDYSVSPNSNGNQPKVILKRTLLVFFVFVLLVFGYRGGWQDDMRISSEVYNRFNNNKSQVIINAAYAMIEDYIFVTPDASTNYNSIVVDDEFGHLQSLLTQKEFSFIDKNFPTLRKSNFSGPSLKKNLIIIVLETYNAYALGSFDSENLKYSPNLSRIAKESLQFNNIWASGNFTNHGFGAIFASYPRIIGLNLLFTPFIGRNFNSLSNIFKKQGYNFFYLQPYVRNSSNVDPFMKIQGFDNIITAEDFSPEAFARLNWGIIDRDMFSLFSEKLDGLKEPFLAVTETASTHVPYKVKAEELKLAGLESADEDYFTAVRYSDYWLSKFFDEIKTKKYYKNSIFIIVADHGRQGNYPNYIDGGRIPLLIFDPTKELIKPAISNAIGNQVDLIPTIVELFKFNTEISALGTSLFSKEKNNNFSLRCYADKCLWVDGDDLLIFNSAFHLDEYYKFDKNFNAVKQASNDAPQEKIINYYSYVKSAYELLLNNKIAH